MFKSIFIMIGVLLSIFLIAFISLINGISVNNFSNESVNINGLYLKYDKKLIFSVKKIEIFDSKDDSKSTFDFGLLKYTNTILNLFQSIKVDDIIFAKEHISVKFKEGIFFIKSNNIEIKLTQKIINNELSYQISSNKIKDIRFINKFLTVTPELKLLIDEQLRFEYIELKNISGKESIYNLNNFNINSVSATLLIKNPRLKYQNYPKVALSDIVLNLSKGDIDIDIEKVNEQKNITFEGNIHTTLENITTKISGNLFYKDLEVKTDNIIKNNLLFFKVATKRFHNISIFEEFVKIPPSIKKWGFKRLKSKSIEVKNINGEIDLENFSIDFSKLRVDAVLNHIVMDFNPKKAYPLLAKKVQVLFNGKNMNFKLTKPKSNDVDLDGSEAIVYDTFGNSGLLLKLQTKSPLNWTLVRAVKSYDVNIADELGVRQSKGISDIEVKIDIPFSEKPMDIFVKITNKNSVIQVKDNPINFKSFNFLYAQNKVILKDTKIIKEGNNIDINHLVFDIKKNNLNLNLDANDINKTFSVHLTNFTNLDQNNTKGNINIKFVDIKDIVSIQNKTIPYRAVFGKETNAILPSLGISYQNKNNYNYINIENLVNLEDMILPLQNTNLKKASVNAKTKDFNNFDLDIDAVSKTNDVNQTFDISLLANLDLNKSNSKGNINIHKLKFQDFVDINKTDIPYSVSFKDDIDLNLPSLAIEYKKNNSTHFIDINNFKHLSKIVKVMEDNNITQGNAHIKTKNFLDMVVKLNLNIEPYGIFHKSKKQKDITLDMKIQKMKKISFKDTNNMLSGNIDITKKPKVNLALNDMGIEYKTKDLNETEETKKEPLTKCENIIFDLPQVTVSMNNGYFKYNENLMNYETINTKTNKNNIYFTLNNNDTNINLYIEGKQIYARINALDSDFLNNAANKEIIDGGYINLSAYGTQCNIKGKSKIKNLNIKDASILNNIFLVINSAPAIINPLLILPNAYRFASDEFQLSEYEIKKGDFNFDFNRNNSVLDIPKLNIFGVHSNFTGKANIDLYNEKIKSNVNIIFMKDYAKIISYIPLVNYVILGDNERFSYSVDVDGNLTNPDVVTHMAKETLMAPVNIIKRVFLLPTLPFRNKDDSKE